MATTRSDVRDRLARRHRRRRRGVRVRSSPLRDRRRTRARSGQPLAPLARPPEGERPLDRLARAPLLPVAVGTETAPSEETRMSEHTIGTREEWQAARDA